MRKQKIKMNYRKYRGVKQVKTKYVKWSIGGRIVIMPSYLTPVSKAEKVIKLGTATEKEHTINQKKIKSEKLSRNR